MTELVKLYWCLRALGRGDDAELLRRAWQAARDGDPAALRRLDATVDALRGALGALGNSPRARMLRASAMSRGAPDAARSSPATPPPRDGHPRERELDGVAALRSQLAARDRRRSRLGRLRPPRWTIAAVLLFAGGAGGFALAARHRAAVEARWERVAARVVVTWRAVAARIGGEAGAPAAAARVSPQATVPDPRATAGVRRAKGRREPPVAASGPAAAAPAPAPVAASSGPAPPPVAASPGRALPPGAPGEAGRGVEATGAGAPGVAAPPRILFIDLGAARGGGDERRGEDPPRAAGPEVSPRR